MVASNRSKDLGLSDGSSSTAIFYLAWKYYSVSFQVGNSLLSRLFLLFSSDFVSSIILRTIDLVSVDLEVNVFDGESFHVSPVWFVSSVPI